MIHNLLYRIKLLLPVKIKDKLKPLLSANFVRSLKKNDCFVISFPKCGRSWLKLIFCDMIYYQFPAQKRIDDVSTEFLYKIDKRIPRIIFTHDHNPMYRKIEELNHNKSEYKNSKLIFLVRDPRDVIVSWFYEYKYRVSEESKREDMKGENISSFIRNERGGLATLVEFYNIWMKEKDKMRNFIIVKYEDIRLNTIDSLLQINQFLNLDEVINKGSVISAVEKNSFENVQKREKRGEIINGKNKFMEFGGGDSEQTLKARKGKVGGYKDTMSDEDIEWVDSYINLNLHPDFRY